MGTCLHPNSISSRLLLWLLMIPMISEDMSTSEFHQISVRIEKYYTITFKNPLLMLKEKFELYRCLNSQEKNKIRSKNLPGPWRNQSNTGDNGVFCNDFRWPIDRPDQVLVAQRMQIRQCSLPWSTWKSTMIKQMKCDWIYLEGGWREERITETPCNGRMNREPIPDACRWPSPTTISNKRAIRKS